MASQLLQVVYSPDFDERDVYACETDYAFNGVAELYSVLTLASGMLIYGSFAVKYVQAGFGRHAAVMYGSLMGASLFAGIMHATRVTALGPSVHLCILTSAAVTTDTLLQTLVPRSRLTAARAAALAVTVAVFATARPFYSKVRFLPVILCVNLVSGAAMLPTLLPLLQSDLRALRAGKPGTGVLHLMAVSLVYLPLHIVCFFVYRSTEPHCGMAHALGIAAYVHAVEHLGDLFINHMMLSTVLLMQQRALGNDARLSWRLAGCLPVVVCNPERKHV